MGIKELFRKQTPIEKVQRKVAKGKVTKQELLDGLVALYAEQAVSFYYYVKRVKSRIQIHNDDIENIKKTRDRLLADEYAEEDQWCKEVDIQYLKMEKRRKNDCINLLRDRNMFLDMAAVAIVTQTIQYQEVFPDMDWSLEHIIELVKENDEVKRKAMEKGYKIIGWSGSLEEFPTDKELERYKNYLLTAFVNGYGAYAEKDFNMFREDGLIVAICNRLDGKMEMSNGYAFTLEETKERSRIKNGVVEENIFKNFIEVDYKGVV